MRRVGGQLRSTERRAISLSASRRRSDRTKVQSVRSPRRAEKPSRCAGSRRASLLDMCGGSFVQSGEGGELLRCLPTGSDRLSPPAGPHGRARPAPPSAPSASLADAWLDLIGLGGDVMVVGNVAASGAVSVVVDPPGEGWFAGPRGTASGASDAATVVAGPGSDVGHGERLPDARRCAAAIHTATRGPYPADSSAPTIEQAAQRELADESGDARFLGRVERRGAERDVAPGPWTACGICSVED